MQHLEWDTITGIINYSGENNVPYTADLFMAQKIAVHMHRILLKQYIISMGRS
jgi:hypothetical protein